MIGFPGVLSLESCWAVAHVYALSGAAHNAAVVRAENEMRRLERLDGKGGGSDGERE